MFCFRCLFSTQRLQIKICTLWNTITPSTTQLKKHKYCTIKPSYRRIKLADKKKCKASECHQNVKTISNQQLINHHGGKMFCIPTDGKSLISLLSKRSYHVCCPRDSLRQFNTDHKQKKTSNVMSSYFHFNNPTCYVLRTFNFKTLL